MFNKNPQYDNDLVTLGYLKNVMNESGDETEQLIKTLPKSFNSPPVPPYYIGSVLYYDHQVYRCNKERLQGSFNWEDWSLVATDNTELRNWIDNTYSVDKLQLEEQIDKKIETHYQENSPSLNWTTDLEKSKHVGDYWYRTTDNTQWRYTRITTNPITYDWQQVNVPNSIFDLIDKKKSIYTSKPTSYKKDDLWIIEDTISVEDIPTGTQDNPIAKGDWVFSTTDSESYNKNHWVKRDTDVSLEYLQAHYYTTSEVEEKVTESERYTDSEITKAKNEINLSVSQNYTTKIDFSKAVSDLTGEINTITESIDTQSETISDLSIGVGEIESNVSNLESTTKNSFTEVNEKFTTINQGYNDISIQVANQSKSIENIDGQMQTINETLDDMSFDFTTKGLKVGSTDDPNNAILDNTGTKIYNYDNLTAVFNHRGSGVDKLIVTGSAQVGYLKFHKGEKIMNGVTKKVTKIYHVENMIEDLDDLL